MADDDDKKDKERDEDTEVTKKEEETGTQAKKSNGENPETEAVQAGKAEAKSVEDTKAPGIDSESLKSAADFITNLVHRLPSYKKQFSRATIVPEHLTPFPQLIVGRLTERKTYYNSMSNWNRANQTYRIHKIGGFCHESTTARAGSAGVNKNIFILGHMYSDSASGTFRNLDPAVIQNSQDYKMSYYIYETLRSHLIGYDGLAVADVEDITMMILARMFIYFGTLHALAWAEYASGPETNYCIAQTGLTPQVMAQMCVTKLQEYWIPEFVKYLFRWLAPKEYTYAGKRSNDDIVLLEIDERMAMYAYCMLYGTKLSAETNNFTMIENYSFNSPKMIFEQIFLTIEMLFLGMSFDQVVDGLRNVRGGTKAFDVMAAQVKELESKSTVVGALNEWSGPCRERNIGMVYNKIHAYNAYLDYDGLNTLPSGLSIQDAISYESGDTVQFAVDMFDIFITEFNDFRSIWHWMAANTFTATAAYAAVAADNQGMIYSELNESTGVPTVINSADYMQFMFTGMLRQGISYTVAMQISGLHTLGGFIGELPSRSQLTHDSVIKFLRTALGLYAISKIRIFQKQGIVVIS